MPLSPYSIQFDDPASSERVVLFCTRTAASVTVDRQVLQDMERNRLSDEERESLFSLGFFVSDPDEEKQEMLAYIDQLNAGGGILKPVVVLNLDCNLACIYCFEGTRKGKYYLSKKTADDIHSYANAGFIGKNEISITFYGGEPLLSVDMISYLSDTMQSSADSRCASYRFNLITNGTLLTRRVVEQLLPLGLEAVTVTLDGPRKIHDKTRPFRSGAGSFDTIMANIGDVCDSVAIHIGGNFTRSNYTSFPELLDTLMRHGLGPDRIASVRFDPVFREGREYSPDFHAGCSSINEPWLAEAGTFLRKQILSAGYSTEEVQPTVCMIERQDQMVINWDGSLYKCPGLIGREEYCVGTVGTGVRDYAASHNVGHWKNEECLACVYLPLCFGGCRYLRLVREGSMQGLECKKDYLDRTLRALVLQDIERRRIDV